MSQLRRQLDSLRRRYAAKTYPGDLASQLLDPPQRDVLSPRWRWVMGGIGAAVAAATALAVLLYDPATDAVGNSVYRLAEVVQLPFIGSDDPPTGASPEPFTIIPEFRHLDVPLPSGGVTAGEESA